MFFPLTLDTIETNVFYLRTTGKAAWVEHLERTAGQKLLGCQLLEILAYSGVLGHPIFKSSTASGSRDLSFI